MSESREDSYYEVALSHRQVVWVFVVLLGCVVAAFLAGIWIGQQQPAAAVVAESPAGEERAGRPGRQLEELNFFRDEEGAPQPAVAPIRGTTLAEDLEAERAAPSAPQAGPDPAAAIQETPKPAAPAPQPSPINRAPVVPAPPIEAPTSETPPSETPPADVPAAPPTGEGLVIQVFSSPDRGQAEQVVERLRGSGHPAFLSPTDVGGKPMFRVRIGPFEERSRAERVAESVRRAFRLDTWITQNS